MEKAVWGFIGAVIVGTIASGIRDAYKDAQREARIRNGTETRWTDAARWERPGRDY